jgi:hypothetical protein
MRILLIEDNNVVNFTNIFQQDIELAPIHKRQKLHKNPKRWFRYHVLRFSQ